MAWCCPALILTKIQVGSSHSMILWASQPSHAGKLMHWCRRIEKQQQHLATGVGLGQHSMSAISTLQCKQCRSPSVRGHAGGSGLPKGSLFALVPIAYIEAGHGMHIKHKPCTFLLQLSCPCRQDMQPSASP
eukprot:1146864-Pelagomonas_calceolata.AAC.1